MKALFSLGIVAGLAGGATASFDSGLAALAQDKRDEAGLREAFEKEFKSKESAPRMEAVKKLSGAKEEKTLALLAGALKDADKGVRKAAAEAIEGSIDAGGVAIKPLCAHLVDKKEDPEVRFACAKALGKAQYKGDPIEAYIKTISTIEPEERHLHEFGAKVTDVLDKFAGDSFGKGKTTPELWQQWWADNRAKILKEDEAKREAYRKGRSK